MTDGQGGWIDAARALLPGLAGGAAPPPDFARRASQLPAAGLLVGALGAAVLWGAGHVWPAAVSVLLAVAAMTWATGAMHERGLAAACGRAGAGERGDAAMPALVVVLVLALRVAALHGLATRDFGAALALLPLLHAWSRAVPSALLLQADAKPRWPAWAAGVVLAMLLPVLAGVQPTVLLEGGVAVLVAGVVAARAWRALPEGVVAARVGLAQQGAELVLALALLAALARG